VQQRNAAIGHTDARDRHDHQPRERQCNPEELAVIELAIRVEQDGQGLRHSM